MRPRTFDQIVGQEAAVRMLRRLLQPRRVGLNILFHGAIGSGKTSMARIYAMGLNCLALRKDGSPCLQCDHCRDQQNLDIGLKEFDIPGLKSRGSNVVEVVRAAAVTPSSGYRILFLDEAHSLSDIESDALLKLVEESSPQLVFLFATTEVHNIRRSLLSRLFPIHIRALDTMTAFRFLQDHATRVAMACEPDALMLLAGLKEGYPRDLLIALEQLRLIGKPLTIERVRQLFDVDHVEALVSYFTALADGDAAAQNRFLTDWHEDVTDKVRWVQAFLMRVYYSDIMSQPFPGDPVIESIPTAHVKAIVARFATRLNVDDENANGLVRPWLRMLNFWSPLAADQDRTNLLLRFTLFHELVNRGLAEPDRITPFARGLRRSNRPGPLSAVKPSPGFFPPVPLPTRALDCMPAQMKSENFIGSVHVRSVMNTASFLIQHYGVLFNACFTLRPTRFGSEFESDHRRITAQFLSEFEGAVECVEGEKLAWLCVYGRDSLSFYCRGVAHLPDLAESGADLQLARVQEWADAWRSDPRGDPEKNGLQFGVAPRPEKARLAFHWRETVALLEGLDQDIVDWDPTSEKWISLRRLLGLRSSKPDARHTETPPFVQTSPLLTPEAIADACSNCMEALSAYDARAWKSIRTGWERAEYWNRRETIRERDQQLSDIADQHEGDEGAASAIKELVAGWAVRPERRIRQRQVKWLQSDDT